MAASDNHAAAAADLRRLAALDEATLRGALAYMGREPFRRLRRAVGQTPTPLPSDDEGDSGPAGASLSTAFRLDPADSQANQMTAPYGANINNLDAVSSTYTFTGATASPTASHATQEPICEQHDVSGHLLGVHQLDRHRPVYGRWRCRPPTAGSSSLPAAAPTTTLVDTPQMGVQEAPEGPPNSTRSRAKKIALLPAAKRPMPSPARKQPPACFSKALETPSQYCALRIAGRPAGPSMSLELWGWRGHPPLPLGAQLADAPPKATPAAGWPDWSASIFENAHEAGGREDGDLEARLSASVRPPQTFMIVRQVGLPHLRSL